MNAQQAEILSVARQAAHWLRTMETADVKTRAEFWEWMSASPLHVRELLLAAQLDQALDGIDAERRIDVRALIGKISANVMPLNTRPSLSPSRKYPRLTMLATAAGCASVLISAAWFGWSNFDTGNQYSTRLGEQRMFDLPDGSIIFLNTQSKVEVRYTAAGRDIDLRAGQALFQVAKDALRPFRVHVADATIQAIGTSFDVRLQSGRATVAVMEGAVKVGQGGRPVAARLSAGEGIAIVERQSPQKNEQIKKIDVEAVTAWRRQRLIFRSEDLATIVDEFNRYNVKPRLSVEGETLRARRFHGTFNAHSPESLLTYLADDPNIFIQRHAGDVVISER